jgi:hypothetical protein
MALPSNTTISISQVSVELGRASNATTSLGEAAVRSLAGIPSGAISLSSLWGKSSIPARGYALGSESDYGRIRYLDLVNETVTALASGSGIGGYGIGLHSTTEGFHAYNGIPNSNPLAFQTSALNFSTGTYTTPYTSASNYFYYLYRGKGINSPLGKGYGAGGGLTSLSSVIFGLTYSTRTTVTQSATISARNLPTQVSSSTKGFIMGGAGQYAVRFADILALVFSTETVSTLGATLSVAGYNNSGGTNSSTAGYTSTLVDTNSAFINTTDKLLFSNETRTVLSHTQTRGIDGAVNSGTSKGYYQGGRTTSANNTQLQNSIYALTFSTDTQVQLSAVLPSAEFSIASATSGGGL